MEVIIISEDFCWILDWTCWMFEYDDDHPCLGGIYCTVPQFTRIGKCTN
jgi:hypothetical protein